MGTSAASEPLNSFHNYDLLIVFSSFLTNAPLEMVALTTSQIYLMLYLKDIINTDKNVIKLAKNLNLCAN